MALDSPAGLVQLGSNANEAWHTRAKRAPRVVVPFALGALVAAIRSAVWFLGKMNLAWVPLLVLFYSVYFPRAMPPQFDRKSGTNSIGRLGPARWQTWFSVTTGPLVSALAGA